MAYDDSTFRRRDATSTDPVGVGADDSRFRGEPGFRDEPDFRPSATSFAEFRDADPDDTTLTSGGRRSVSSHVLDDVFDDPDHGDPGRDRMGVHAAWEVVLLLAVGAVGFLLYREESAAVRGDRLDSLLVFAAALGLLAVGASLTLRAAAPNLALGPVAAAAALHFAENGDRGVVPATGIALGVAALAGVALAVLVVGFHVPGWAASFALVLVVIVYIQQRPDPVTVQGEYDPNNQALYLFGAFAGLSLLGGLLGTFKPIRRAVGRFRPVTDPARRRGGVAATLTTLSLIGSMILGVVAGVLFAAGGGEPVAPTAGLELTGLAFGAAMLGGTSAFGRRGGVFGTLFAVVLLTLFIAYAEAMDWDIALYAIAAAAVAAGVVVTRLVETFGRPLSAQEEGEDWEADTQATIGWSTTRQGSWSSALPAQPTGGAPDPWDKNDRWST